MQKTDDLLTSGLHPALLAVLFACVVSLAVTGCAPVNREPHNAPRLLVQPRAGVTLEALDRILERYGARRVGVIPKINVHVVEAPPQANARAVAAMLKNHPEIEAAELDERVAPAVRSSTPQPQ